MKSDTNKGVLQGRETRQHEKKKAEHAYHLIAALFLYAAFLPVCCTL